MDPDYLPLRLNPEHVVCLDTETTGLDEKAEVVQLAIIGYRGDVLFNKFIKPCDPIPAEATKIHRISNESVENERSIMFYWDYVCNRFLKENIVLGFNVLYDIRILMQSVARFGLSNRKGFNPTLILDVMMLFKAVTVTDGYTKLEQACDYFNIQYPGEKTFHDAKYDAIMTLLLFRKLMEIQPK